MIVDTRLDYFLSKIKLQKRSFIFPFLSSQRNKVSEKNIWREGGKLYVQEEEEKSNVKQPPKEKKKNPLFGLSSLKTTRVEEEKKMRAV